MSGQQTEISVAELKRRLDRGEVEFLFDMRNTDEFDSWRIEGRRPIETINIPQIDFVGEEEKYLDRLPRDKEMVIVCAHGGASKYTAELLQEKGFRAVGLEGGMDAWSEFYQVTKIQEAPEIHQVYRVAKGCITHIVIADGEAIVVDPVRHLDRILAVLRQAGARVVAVVDTHLQADHISGGRDLAAQTGAPYWISPEDAKDAAYPYEPLVDGTLFRVGSCRLTAMHSPGHTPGSTSLLLNNRFLLSGDAIMRSSPGRPDLGGRADEWSLLLYDTLFHRFSSLADDVVVLPSHAASMQEMNDDGSVRLTMGEARDHELFHTDDKEQFIAKVAASLPENPERYQDIRKVNLGLLDPDEDKRKELEIGKNLCGMSSR